MHKLIIDPVNQFAIYETHDVNMFESGLCIEIKKGQWAGIPNENRLAELIINCFAKLEWVALRDPFIKTGLQEVNAPESYEKKYLDNRWQVNLESIFSKLQNVPKERFRGVVKVPLNILFEHYYYDYETAEYYGNFFFNITNKDVFTISNGSVYEFDVFLSHASENKSFVRPLAELLACKGLRVWYDEFCIGIGDSVWQSIQYGLVKSRFGVLILSKKFIEKRWTQAEVNALASIEFSGTSKRILPIWYDVGHADVLEWSPILADRKAIIFEGLSTEMAADALVFAINKASNMA